MPQGLTTKLGELQSIASLWNLMEHITWSASAALVLGSIVCYSETKQSELPSELLCWMLVPVVFAIAKRRRNVDSSVEALLPLVKSISEKSSETQAPSSISLWIIAACIVVCSIFRAERGIIILFPALAPLLAIVHRYLRPGPHPPAGHHFSLSAILRHNILGTTLTAVLAIAALSEWDPIAYAISAAPLAALFVAYTLLTPQPNQRSHWLGSVDIEHVVSPLALRVAALLVAALGGESYLFGLPGINAVEMLLLGPIKALMWYFTSQLARNSSWLVAAAAGTFSLLATRDPFMQPTDTRALMVALASLLALVQVVYLLPKQAKARLTLLVLAAIPLVPYLSDLAAIQFAQSSAIRHAEKHPVEMLIREANANFDSLLRNQSSTYAAAYAEYQRRYGFEPPDGFEEWYKFAQEHQSPIIDEFDIISEGVAPFLRMSGQEFLDIMSVAYDEPDHELWSCVMSGQPAQTECSHHGRENDRNNAHFFNRVTEKIPVAMDLKFLLNHLDEPTVMIPPLSANSIKPVITNRGGERAWEVLTQFCSLKKGEMKSPGTSTVETYGLPFVTDRKATMDLCRHPEYSDSHGLLAAPESLRLIEGLVPVLSNGAPSTMGDILYPSTAYIEEDRFAYHTETDVDWDKKQNNLYWAGSTTGGRARPGEWHSLHRQRFVELAQNLQHRTFSYLREKKGVISREDSSFLNGRLYDVAFAQVLQCDVQACREQRQYFTRKPWASGSRPYHSRLVFDLDGNGISGRYYKLLASKSLPLKQTIIREWHDERLLPWVHYIPVSQHMEELPELVFYLTSTENGQKRAREIAERGQQWFAQAFRQIDVVIYMYRLLLELARLQDPDRPAWQLEVR